MNKFVPKVEGVTTRAYKVPLAEAWGDQTHQVTHIELVIVDVVTDTETVGTGFSYSVGVGGKAIQAFIEWYLVPRLVGHEAVPQRQWHRLWREAHDGGGGGIASMALGALDIALWDIVAKSREMSLVDTLGRVRPSVPVYASGINLNLSVDQLLAQVGRWRDRGYDMFKIKVGRELSEDVERVRQVRKLIGDDCELMVDANQGWNMVTAERAFAAFEDFRLKWIEEPLLSDDIHGHALLRSRTRVPVAVGENIYTRYQFLDYMRMSACDIVQADVVRVGGITPFLEIAAIVASWGLDFAPHFMSELTGQLLCCVETEGILEDVEGGSLSELGVLAEPFLVRDGRYTPPSRSGHGIVFDRGALAVHSLDSSSEELEDRAREVAAS
jgi:L-alanine-DL-glutamate epimerase-like enolase superfamily enzyme